MADIWLSPLEQNKHGRYFNIALRTNIKMADGCVDIVLSLGIRKEYIFWHASFAKKQGGMC
jgi:hypothetical protein